MRRSLPLLLLLLGLLVAVAPATAAKSHRVDVPKTLAEQIDRAKGETDVPILLPSRYISTRKRLYGSGGAIEDTGYAFALGLIRNCNGAGACSTASFAAERGGTPGYKRRVSLANGIRGYYKPLTCGASCADPEIQWLDDGILYSISAAAGTEKTEKRRMVDLANSAIRNGPR